MKRIIVLLLFPWLTEASVQFEQRVVCEGGIVHSAKAADYNNDGLKDLIYAAGGGIQLAMAPDFIPRQIFATPKPLKAGSYHSHIMDVDGDGDMDFIAENKGLYWLECPDRPEHAPWRMHWISRAFTGIHCITVHDLDEDDRKDIVVNNYWHKGQRKGAPNDYPASILWYRVPDDPTDSTAWRANVLADGDAKGGSHYIAFADLDGDGHDEAFHGAKGKPFWWGNYFACWTRGDDVFRPWKKKKLPGRHKGATHVYGGDLTGDGKIDVVGSCGHGSGIVLFPAPEFRPRKIDEQLVDPHAFEMVDIEGDGDLDLFCCANGSQQVQWFENDGTGSFARHQLADNQQSYEIYICDLDDDADLDLVIAGYQSRNIALFYQK